MRKARLVVALLGVAGTASIALICASIAGAAAPGTWNELQGPTLPSPISQFGAVAGADGSLFVAFADAGPAGKAGRATLARTKRLAITVAINARNAAGKTKTTTRTITLRVAAS